MHWDNIWQLFITHGKYSSTIEDIDHLSIFLIKIVRIVSIVIYFLPTSVDARVAVFSLHMKTVVL